MATRHRVLANIKELMKESDWHTITKDVLESQHPRPVQAELDIII